MRLAALIGEWRLEATYKDIPATDAGARVVFEWLPDERFLIERWKVPVPEAPDGIAIIGADPENHGNYLQHYFDSRGVARVYNMSFGDGMWNSGATRRISHHLISHSATWARSATTARASPVPGRSATTAGLGARLRSDSHQSHSQLTGTLLRGSRRAMIQHPIGEPAPTFL
jgi:hypothetical protein